MKVWIVSKTTRKNDDDQIIGPFSTFEKAKQAVRNCFEYWSDEKIKSYKEYGSDIEKGRIFTEETSAEVLERELD